jgi:hypothetical protein
MFNNFNVRPFDGRVELEIECPQRVRCDRAHRPDCGADPAMRLLAFPIGHFQSFLTPQAMDPLVVDLPAVGDPEPVAQRHNRVASTIRA